MAGNGAWSSVQSVQWKHQHNVSQIPQSKRLKKILQEASNGEKFPEERKWFRYDSGVHANRTDGRREGVPTFCCCCCCWL